MSAQLIDGKAVAARIHEQVATAVRELVSKGQRAPGLATVLVGEDPASQVYVRNKRATCEKVGIRSVPIHFDATLTQERLLAEIDRLNADATVDGILVQLPLPKQIDSNRVIERIAPEKDVDGFHPYNFGRLAQKNPLLRPCTPFGSMKLLESTGVALRGARAVILGTSNIVGRPMALELLMADATITVCNSKTRDLPDVVRQADIVVAGIGRANFVQGDWIKHGAVVIDVGMNRLPDGKLTGDVDFAAAKERASHITPVPGGVGPMTIAMLMENTLRAARLRQATT
jgi:methylenetetrahydrofolate dehydrogenase (NADP+)/methenyltetrahydrofolate cyclohydrolase